MSTSVSIRHVRQTKNAPTFPVATFAIAPPLGKLTILSHAMSVNLDIIHVITMLSVSIKQVDTARVEPFYFL